MWYLKMNDFTILHLSDLHINQTDGRLSLLMQNLLIDIEKEMQLVDNIIIVVTGDLVHKGNYSYKESVISFFRKLYKITKGKVKDIYIVPGNHDKTRNAVDAKMLEEYESCILNNEFYQKYWKYILLGFEEYQNLIKEIYSIFVPENEKKKKKRERNEWITKKFKDDTYGVSITELNDKRICFLLLNTAWSCLGDKDERKLRFGKFQLDTIKQEYEKNKGDKGYDLVIALAHHPLNWLTGEEETMVQENLLSNYELNCNIYISGHIHNRDVINWQSTRHSLTTLVSGLGWPDEEDKDKQHPYAHTYSGYTFNLDINSIDVYVRSTNDNSIFDPDFRIYTKRKESQSNKIVMPIDSNKTQAFLNLGTVIGRSSKSYYITEEVIELIRMCMGIFSKFQRETYATLNLIKRDFLKQLDKDASYYKVEKYFFEGQERSDELLKFIGEQEESVNRSYVSYLQNICCKLENLLEEGMKSRQINSIENEAKQCIPWETVRVHFRYYNVSDDSYEQLCLAESKIWSGYKMEPLKWGQLLEEAYKAKHALVASINKKYCEESNKKNAGRVNTVYKWSDFLTYIPDFKENNYKEYKGYMGELSKERPWISFGITVYNEQSRKILYILDYLNIGQIISDCLKEFIYYIPVDMEKFVDTKMKERW